VDTNYSTTSSVAIPEDDSSDVFQMTASLDYRQERYGLSAFARSGTRPSGSGRLDKTNQLILNYRYQVTERSSLGLRLVGGKNSSLDNTGIDSDRDYARAILRLDYRISQSWYVAGSYRYSYQDRENEGGQADSNQINLSLIFQPEKFVWSR